MADVPERFSDNRDDRRSIDRESSANQAEKNAWRSLIAGMRFVLRRKVFLATITLDFRAVLLGCATTSNK